jgi:hypothetical protein
MTCETGSGRTVKISKVEITVEVIGRHNPNEGTQHGMSSGEEEKIKRYLCVDLRCQCAVDPKAIGYESWKPDRLTLWKEHVEAILSKGSISRTASSAGSKRWSTEEEVTHAAKRRK